VTTKDSRSLWVVDWVTTLPEFRKLGLSSRLLREVLQRGDAPLSLVEFAVLQGSS
jgi:GNAT superfamily N-acetyltransferase